MNWLDTLLAGRIEKECSPCSHDLKPSSHAGLEGDKRRVPDLSPTCPLTKGGGLCFPYRESESRSPLGFFPDSEKTSKADLSPELSPSRPAPVLGLSTEWTKGTKGTRPEQGSTIGGWDGILESQAAGLPYSDACDLREERAGILEYEAGFTRAEAEQMARPP